MDNKMHPQGADSMIADTGINLIYHTNISLQTKISAVEEKSNVL